MDKPGGRAAEGRLRLVWSGPDWFIISRHITITLSLVSVWSGLVWSGRVGSGLVWSGLVRSGLVWSGLVWSGLV